MTRSNAAATGLFSLQPDTSSGTNRGLAAIVAAASAQAVEHPDAELIGLGRRWRAVQHDWWTRFRIVDRAGGDIGKDEEMQDLDDRLGWLIEAIMATPASTVAGLAVKARILATQNGCDVYDDAGIAAWADKLARNGDYFDKANGSLIVDLLRLTRGDSR